MVVVEEETAAEIGIALVTATKRFLSNLNLPFLPTHIKHKKNLAALFSYILHIVNAISLSFSV